MKESYKQNVTYCREDGLYDVQTDATQVFHRKSNKEEESVNRLRRYLDEMRREHLGGKKWQKEA